MAKRCFFRLIEIVRYDKIKSNRKKDFHMKRLIAVLAGLLVLPAYAEVMPVFYDDMIEYSDEEIIDPEFSVDAEPETPAPAPAAPVVPVKPTSVSPRAAATTSRASRAVATGTTSGRAGTGTTSRAVTARTAVSTPTRVAASSGTVASRAGASRASASRNTATSATKNTANVSSRRNTPTGTTTARAASTMGLIQTDTVSTPLYTGRVSVRGNTTAATQGTRMSTGVRSSTTTAVSATSPSDMDQLTELTEYCKAQYTSCMDNYCNVLDENQGRCSCSANLKNYEQNEAALRQVSEDLQDVAQQIQYIGLSKDEVDTLFTQTEAELKMQTTTDSSKLKNDLDRIKKMIVDVSGGTTTSNSSSNGVGLDLSGLLDFNFDSMGFDLGSFLGTNNSTTITNQRGTELFKTAAARCKASVLNNCSAQGVDINIVTNAYDLEIDKACMAYEFKLSESNAQMSQTVRNAKNVLLRARLLVGQQKNAYDLRGCVNELDKCMQDEFVCGTNYENCLDSTGKFIVKGNVVVGSEPGEAGNERNAFYTAVWGNNGASIWASNDGLAEYIEDTVQENPTRSGAEMSKFLQYKIGYYDDTNDKNYGMCISVLNKCQDYTYNVNGTKKEYNPKNNVVKEYLQRTMVQIKAAQDAVLSEYAQECITDVATCLAQNNYGSSASSQNVAKKACGAVIKTCKSITGSLSDDAFFETVTNQSTASEDGAMQACIRDLGSCLNTQRYGDDYASQSAAMNTCLNKSYAVSCKKIDGNVSYWYKVLTGKDMAPQNTPSNPTVSGTTNPQG